MRNRKNRDFQHVTLVTRSCRARQGAPKGHEAETSISTSPCALPSLRSGSCPSRSGKGCCIPDLERWVQSMWNFMGPFPSKFRCVLRASGENLRIPGSYFEYSGHLWLLQRLSWQYPQTVCIQEHSTYDNLQCSGSSINSTCAETSKNSTFFEAIRSRPMHLCLRKGIN